MELIFCEQRGGRAVLTPCLCSKGRVRAGFRWAGSLRQRVDGRSRWPTRLRAGWPGKEGRKWSVINGFTIGTVRALLTRHATAAMKVFIVLSFVSSILGVEGVWCRRGARAKMRCLSRVQLCLLYRGYFHFAIVSALT